MFLKWYASDLSWVRQHLLPLAVVSLLVVPACATDSRHEDSLPRSLDEALGQALPPPSEEDLRELAEQYGLDDPPQDVEFERYISPEEYAAVMVPCLTEQGIPVRVLSDGGIGFDDIPLEQALLQMEAMYRCDARFPTHPLFAEPLDNDQLRRLYEYLLEDLMPCLEEEGYATPQPPTVEAFIASYSDPEAEMWSPYPVEDPRLGQELEWNRLNEVCPQSPPLEALYDG